MPVPVGYVPFVFLNKIPDIAGTAGAGPASYPPNNTLVTFDNLYQSANPYTGPIDQALQGVVFLSPRGAALGPGVTQLFRGDDGLNSYRISVVGADSVWTLEGALFVPSNGYRVRFVKVVATVGKIDFKNNAATLLGTLPAAVKGWHEFEYQAGLGGWNISAWGGGATVP